MLKSLDKEDHNSNNFSEYCFSFYFQPATPLTNEERQAALPNTMSNFPFLISFLLLVWFPKSHSADSPIHFFNGSNWWISNVVQWTYGGFWCGVGCTVHMKQHFWNERIYLSALAESYWYNSQNISPMSYDSTNAFYSFIFESFVNKTLKRSV